MRSKRIGFFALLAAATLPFLGPTTWAGRGGNKGGGGGGGSPPESEIAFFASKGDKLMVMDSDGANALEVLRAVAGIGPHPSWSPDGTQLAFNATIDGPGIYVVNVDGTGLTKVATTATQYVGRPAWSPAAAPDGQSRIVFEDEEEGGGGRELYLVNPDGTGRMNLTNTSDVDETHPTWSAEADAIAYVAGFNAGAGWGKDVFTADLVLVGGSLTLSTPWNLTAGTALDHGDLAFLDWNRAGDRLAVCSDPAGVSDWDIWVLDAAGLTAPVNVTQSPDVWERQPTWSPDDSMIAFWHDGGRRANGVYVMDADGSNLTQLASGGRAPDWKR